MPYKPKNPRLPYQFFGRLISAELACPACGTLHELRGASPFWNPQMSRFTCRNDECRKKYDFGIVAWEPARGLQQMPPDQIYPTLKGTLRTRATAGALHSRVAEYIRRAGDPVNVVEPEKPEK